MTSPAQLLHAVPIILSLLVLASCAGPMSFGPPPPGYDWFLCEEIPADRASATIGAEGGTLSVSHATLIVPPNAVGEQRLFILVQPRSRDRRVEATVAGNVTFQQPVRLTLSTQGCNVQDSDTLTIFRLNANGPHDNVGGTRRGNLVTSDGLDHLSDYVLVTTRDGV